MKGRGNNKPSAKYHDAIMALLMHHREIKHLLGGGYLPENNFSLDDLSADDERKLRAARPELFEEPLMGCTALYRGKPFYIATFDEDGQVKGTYTAWEAEDGDYQSHFYMSPRDNKLCDADQYFWIDHKNEIAVEDKKHNVWYRAYADDWYADITFLDANGKPTA